MQETITIKPIIDISETDFITAQDFLALEKEGAVYYDDAESFDADAGKTESLRGDTITAAGGLEHWIK